MKLQLGKRYRTACGFITGTLVVNYSQGTHGFLDPHSLRQYNGIGEESGGNPIDTIVSVYYTWSNDSTPMVAVENDIEKSARDIIEEMGLDWYNTETSARYVAEFCAARQKDCYSEAELILYLEWIGGMGWYYEKEKNQWVHDDELGAFKSTQDLVNYYKIESLKNQTL